MPTASTTALVAWASALGGSFVGGLFAIANTWFNHRAETKREKERTDREDRREKERAERQSHERLDDLRRIECVQLVHSAARLAASWPQPLTDDDKAVIASSRAGLEDANHTLQLLGPESLAKASSELAGATRRHASSEEFGRPPRSNSEYTNAEVMFFRVAKNRLGYDQEPR